MKKIVLFLFLLCCIPSLEVQAADFELKNGKKQTGTYAGEEVDVYNYYKVTPSKNGFIEIKATTSDSQNLLIDICDGNRVVIASEISIPNKKSVLHKVEKKKDYYIRIKGTPNVTYAISYKMKKFEKLSYAKKYTYTFTNASFQNKSNAMELKIKSNMNGNLNFMCKAENPIMIQYLNNKKDAISSKNILVDNNLTGIGVKANKVYYIKLWNSEKTIKGTTTISNMKYQIKSVVKSYNTSRGKAITLKKDKYRESLMPADNKSTYWYKVNLDKDQKLSVFIESRMLQMSGSCVELDLYNRNGQKITTSSIKIDEAAYATYKSKKYKMNYPVKSITTGKLPSDTYYIRIISKSKKTSGSFRVKWN